jgi:cyclic pyranopterin phosphate synthase
MPAEGMPWVPRPELLTDAEVVRLVGVFVDLGIREVRFTGGEPLPRRERPSTTDTATGVDCGWLP